MFFVFGESKFVGRLAGSGSVSNSQICSDSHLQYVCVSRALAVEICKVTLGKTVCLLYYTVSILHKGIMCSRLLVCKRKYILLEVETKATITVLSFFDDLDETADTAHPSFIKATRAQTSKKMYITLPQNSVYRIVDVPKCK